MKANELMIGSYVKFLGKVRKIKSIVRKDTGAEISFEGKNKVVVSLDEIEPIPLTPEILEKNGFEIQEQGGGRIDVWTGCGPDAEGDIEIEFDNGVPIHLKIDAAFKGEYYTSNNIHFAHELQHALRLCGIEKIIEL